MSVLSIIFFFFFFFLTGNVFRTIFTFVLMSPTELQWWLSSTNFTPSGDGSWCFTCNPEIKRQSADWCGLSSSSTYKTVLTKNSKLTIMLILYFNSKGVVYRKSFHMSRLSRNNFTSCFLDYLCKYISHIMPNVWKNRRFFLLHDHVPTQTTTFVCFSSESVSQFWPPPHSLLILLILWTSVLVQN